MNARIAFLSVSLLSASAFAKPTLNYKAPAEEEDERPVATEVTVAPQGSDIAFKLVFNRMPWGDECKNRCANVTLFVDTDNSTSTGLQLGPKAAETGADLSVNVQGVRDYKEKSADVMLRAKVRTFGSDATGVEQGEVLTELDNRHDTDRVQSEENTVYVLVDATSAALPSGKQMRVIYHPPGQSPIKGMTNGMLAGGSGKVEVFKKGQKTAEPKKKK
ncbi:MAG: hypothetical protein ACJ790_01520 [Myxococcaceae bacterium]